MINRRFFSCLKNVFMFLIYRLYREWQYVFKKGQSYDDKASERGDLYVKQLIENIIHDRASKYDPYIVDRSNVFSWGRTSIILVKPCVTGLSTLHRTNICALTEMEDRLFINANVGAGPLSYRRQIILRYGKFEQKVFALMSFTNVKVSVDFSVEKGTGRNGLFLNLDINELNGFKLSVNGYGYFDWIINLFLSFGTLVLRRVIRNLLENELEQYMILRLPKYQFPVEGTSLRNGSKINILQDSQVNEASRSESFMRQDDEKPKWSRLSPISKSRLYNRYSSIENGTVKSFGCNLKTTKTSDGCLQTNKWASKMNRFYLLAHNASLRSDYLLGNSSTEDSKDKTGTIYAPFSVRSRETFEIARLLNRIKGKSDSIYDDPNSWTQGITANNNLKILNDDCPLHDGNIPDELDISEIESNISKSTDTAISSTSKAFEDEQSFLQSEVNIEKESEIEKCSQILRDSCRNLAKKYSGNVTEISKQSETSFEIYELSCTKNTLSKTLNLEANLPTRISYCDSFISKKTENSLSDENVLELEAVHSSTKSEDLIKLNLTNDSKTMKSQILQDEKKVIGDVSDKRKEESEDSSKTQQISIDGYKKCRSLEDFSDPIIGLNLRSTEIFQNDLFSSYKIDELKKDLKGHSNDLWQENQSLNEDPESIKSNDSEILDRNQDFGLSEARYISDSEEDGKTGFNSNTKFDQMQPQMIKDEKSFEEGNETVSTSIEFSEEHKNEATKILLKYCEVYIDNEFGENLLKPDKDYTADSSSSSEELNISSNFQNDGTIHNNLLEKLELSLSDKGIDCPDRIVEFSSIAGLKLNADSNESLSEKSDLNALHDLQQEIIAKIRKKKVDTSLESDTEDSDSSNDIPVSNMNLQYESKKLIYTEVNPSLKDPKKNYLEIASVLNGICPSSPEQEHAIEYHETLPKIDFVSESDAEITELVSSEKNKSIHEM